LKGKHFFGPVAASLVLGAGLAPAQDRPVAPGFVAAPAKAAPAADTSGLRTGPATIAPHWSKYKYPESVPEGAAYYIIEKGDTLWDLSKRFLGNPYLWPQIWDQNRYVKDAHWIYPGDPLTLPKVALVAEQAGGPGTEGGPGELGAEEAGEGPVAGAPRGSELQPITEEATMQCAAQVVNDREDESLFVIGAELGADKIAYADRDILYLSKGSNAGVKPGDIYTLHHVSYKVKHPATGKFLGHKIDTTGWLEVVLVNDETAIGVITQSCQTVHIGDYLKPMERVNVPLVLNRPAATRLTPPSGKLDRVIVDIQDDSTMAGQGSLVTIDAGADSGVAPGNIFTIYRITYPSIPSPRNVLGELAVLSVKDRTALAKVTMSYAEVMVGDAVELR
jgi:LysM repeat protein